MTRDSRIFISRIIVAVVFVASIISAAFSHFLMTLIVVAGGMLAWLLYLLSADLGNDDQVSDTNGTLGRNIGKVLAALGLVLSGSAFLTYGIEQTMWGGYIFSLQGVAAAMLILLITLAPLVIMQLTSTREFQQPEIDANLHAPIPPQPFYQPAETDSPAYDDESEYFDEEDDEEEEDDGDEDDDYEEEWDEEDEEED